MPAWENAPIVKAADSGPAWANAPVITPSTPPAEPKEYDPVPQGGKAPEGFYAVTGDDGKQTLRKNQSFGDIIASLNNLPGMGLAEHAGAGLVNLGGKAVSGLAGILSGGNPDTVRQVQDALHVTPPQSNDPILQGMGALNRGAEAIGAPVDKAVGNLPPGARTAIEATEEAIPDVASVLGMRGAIPEGTTTQTIARSPQDVAKEVGYTGLSTRADLAAPGNQAITNALISKDAGMLPGQTPSIAALDNAIKIGPGKVYRQAERDIPQQLTMRGDPLQDALKNLPNQVSQLPRSPDVEALQETMLSKPDFTRDELFANIREARERAKAHWKSGDPDKDALGDAYHALANSYEDFAGRQLEAANSDVSLADWQAARTQMAKNYQARAALSGPQGGENFNAQAYARTAERNPGLLTGDAAIVGHIAKGLPTSAAPGVVPDLAGAAAQTAGYIPVAGPMIRAKLEQLRTRGNSALPLGTQSNPALSYFFPQGKNPPPGWGRAPPAPPQFGGYLPSPAMVNAGGGMSTQNALEALGLTPDVQAAGALHPGAERLQALREQVSQPPMENIEPPRTQKWGEFSLSPQGAPPAAPQEGIPFANVLEHKPPPGGTPILAQGPPPGASDAQINFRNKLAADRLRKLAGDLRMEGPGGATGSPLDRARAALQRRQAPPPQAGQESFDDLMRSLHGVTGEPPQGFAKGGSVRRAFKGIPIVREIKAWPRDKDGGYIQPDKITPELAVIMAHNSERAVNQAQFATSKCGNQHTYDPTGDTICWHCNQYDKENNDCEVIVDIVAGLDGDIQEASSCRHFETIRAGDWEVKLKRMTKAEAMFGTARNGKGFGCGSKQKQRCGWRRTSKWGTDLYGDDTEWCSAYFMPTEPTGCCAINSTPTLPDGTPLKRKH
jgi:hypothetical protein